MLSVPPSVPYIIKAEINKPSFDLLYDKYGSMIYTVVLKAVKYDTKVVEILMKQVFVELSTKKRNDIQTSHYSCVQILQVVVSICGQYGCNRDDIMQAIGIPKRTTLSELNTSDQA